MVQRLFPIFTLLSHFDVTEKPQSRIKGKLERADIRTRSIAQGDTEGLHWASILRYLRTTCWYTGAGIPSGLKNHSTVIKAFRGQSHVPTLEVCSITLIVIRYNNKAQVLPAVHSLTTGGKTLVALSYSANPNC